MKTSPDSLADDTVQSISLLLEGNQTPATAGDGGKPFVIVSQTQRVEPVDRLLARPTRKTATPTFFRCESFTRYVTEHKTDQSRIYVTAATILVAVIDHNGTHEADWAEHRATYQMKHSLEWLAWTGKDKAKMTQKDFCEFIEDNSLNIVGRTDMVELIRTLQVNSNVDYKSFERGDNGNSALTYIRTVQSKAGERGEVELPPTFQISIPAFEGGVPATIVAKLRFDIGEGKLKLWYELQQLPRILQEHTDAVVAAVEQATAIKPFYGQP
jgi:uncharacterized protein YfdQ (DUF2303 family)